MNGLSIHTHIFPQEYIDQARRLRDADVGLYGIGIQSHFMGYPDIHLCQVSHNHSSSAQ